MSGIVGILGFGAACPACCSLRGLSLLIACLAMVSIGSVLWFGNVEGLVAAAVIPTGFVGLFRRMAAKAKSDARYYGRLSAAHTADARSSQIAQRA